MTILIGTYTGDAGPAGVSQGIYAADWDDANGVLGPLRLAAELKHPSFIVTHPALPLAYAVSETGGGTVAAIRWEGGRAHVVGTWPSHGDAPCHAAVDARGEFLVVSNYTSGTAAVWPLTVGIPGGTPTVLRLSGHGPDASRQKGPHAHSARFEPGGDRFWIQDLGSDRLWGFALDRAARIARPLDPPAAILAPGCGPRHMAFHPGGRWAYVINELDSTVIALVLDPARGTLTPFQEIGTLPPEAAASPGNYCADIHASPDGAYLYGSNRGHDSLAVWRIGPADGRLTVVQHIPSGGGHPRNFMLTPDGGWLLCANRDADTIAVFRREAASGRLERVGIAPAPHPVCLVVAPSPAG